MRDDGQERNANMWMPEFRLQLCHVLAEKCGKVN
jgi:hypothetical protein